MKRRTAPAYVWTKKRKGGLEVLQAPSLEKLAWLAHGFSTRAGGTSVLGNEHVLSLGFTEWDTRENVLANREKLLVALSAEDMPLATLRQIHSDVIHVLDAVPQTAPKGDAAITRAPGVLLAVQTADCIPILLVDTKRRAVAAIHAGWRGTLQRIAAKTLGRMRLEFGTRPGEVLAALGPGIGRCCYHVGIEVVTAFHAQFARAREWFDGPFDLLVNDYTPNPLQWLNRMPPGHQPPPPTAQLDLIAANRWQLEDAGVKPRSISVSGLCTACRPDLLFSHRAQHGKTGRMMAVIGIRQK